MALSILWVAFFFANSEDDTTKCKETSFPFFTKRMLIKILGGIADVEASLDDEAYASCFSLFTSCLFTLPHHFFHLFTLLAK